MVARLATTEQVAQRIADLVAESFPAEQAAAGLFDDGGGRWSVVVHFAAAPDAAALRALVAAAAGTDAARALRFERVPATDWVKASLSGLRPVTAGRFLVHGGHDRAAVAPNRVGIEIEAALAFGTGHHGTTRGCLLALDRILRRRRPRRVLDLGTGTGVLAIAAARVLHQRVLATDIDVTAIQTARANARLNRAGPRVEVVRADGVTTPRVRVRAPFDLVFANILLNPLKRLAAPLKLLVEPGGWLVLSGLLAAQANAAMSSYRGLALQHRIDIEGWTTLMLVRPIRGKENRRRRRLRLRARCVRHPPIRAGHAPRSIAPVPAGP